VYGLPKHYSVASAQQAFADLGSIACRMRLLRRPLVEFRHNDHRGFRGVSFLKRARRVCLGQQTLILLIGRNRLRISIDHHIMLDWIKGGKADHPMADLKRVRDLIAALPSGNSLRALEEMTGWLDSINDAPGFKLRTRLDAIDLLDRAAKNHQFKLAPEYLEAPRLQKFYESRLWNTSFGFWKSLGDGYLKCIEQCQGSGSGAEAVSKDLPMIAGRAMRTLTLQIKWILLRYGLIEDRIWRDLGRVYLFAEGQGLATRRAQIYPGKHGESTVQEEFLKAVMLVASSPDGLPPAKLHIAERVVAHFAHLFSLQQQAGAGCGFCFDLALHRPPARVTRAGAEAPTVRFFGAGKAAAALHDLVRVVRERNAIPPDINLGGTFDSQMVSSVLDHLEQYWGDNLPQRNAHRRELTTRVTVVPGFADTLVWIQAAADSTSLEFSDPQSAESWIVFNASDGGYGTVVPKLKGDWLHVGHLVGLQAETSNLCRIGVVRRMTRDQYDQRRVGIQLLETTAVPVALSPAQQVRPEDGARHADTAILLSSRPDRNREVALLMRAGAFATKRRLHMMLAAGSYVLEPINLVEAGEDFDWARFRVMEKLPSAES